MVGHKETQGRNSEGGVGGGGRPGERERGRIQCLARPVELKVCVYPALCGRVSRINGFRRVDGRRKSGLVLLLNPASYRGRRYHGKIRTLTELDIC